MSANEELVELGDPDELVRHVGRLARAGDWDGLEDLRQRCRRAHERGRQLWGVASLAEYRLALEAPPAHAAAAIIEGAGQGALGPLSEVIAVHHSWDDLAPHLAPGPLRAVVAHERVLRGDRPERREVGGPDPFGLPLHLAPWEPSYPLAGYEPERVDLPAPPLPSGVVHPVAAVEGRAARDDLVTGALTGLAASWVEGSNGRAQAVATEGDADHALAVLGVPPGRAGRRAMAPAEALAWMAWAAASGGAHGRRRGAAAGRFEALWALAALAGLAEDWPVPDDELGEAAHELRWWWWDAGEPEVGWQLRLAVEDPAEHLSWALGASDAG